MTNAEWTSWFLKCRGAVVLAIVAGVVTPGVALAADTASNPVTFAKDVAPILQAKCQVCHRPGSIAPMSLLTYEESRPWARSIKQRVVMRDMPPWHLDKTMGIQHFKNDRSLSDHEIDTIAKWVDAGAPLGNAKDLPPTVQWPDDDAWTIGKPDLIVSMPKEITMYANGPDWWPHYDVDTGLTEDRYIKATETKPSKAGRRIVHHAGVNVIGAPDAQDASEGRFISEYAVGKYGDIFGEDTGLLIKAGARVSFGMHYHSIGEETRDRTRVGFVFYPKGYKPKYVVKHESVGYSDGSWNNDKLDIPPNSITRHDIYQALSKPTRLLNFQPHMHMRGKAMTLEAIYPDGKTEVLSSVSNFDFNWHVSYVYAEDAAPLLPAGTILHAIGIHDNTVANRKNPDPNQWVGYGMRSIDDMILVHSLRVYLSEEDFQRQVAERKAKARQSQ